MRSLAVTMKQQVTPELLRIAKEYRAGYNMGKDAVAAACGVSKTAIIQVENGSCRPSMEFLIQLLAVSGVSKTRVLQIMQDYINSLEWANP